MNRDESLAFWYLRLNGFFLVPHFVVHTKPPSEIDFLALRPPNVSEEVGGRPGDWDSRLIPSPDRGHFVCVFCEVKGGRRPDPATLFRDREIRHSISRFGLLTEPERQHAIAQLRDRPRWRPRPDIELRKLLVAHQDMPAAPPHDFVSLEETRQFIRGRLDEYRDDKAGARALFNADRIDELLADIERAEAWGCPEAAADE